MAKANRFDLLKKMKAPSSEDVDEYGYDAEERCLYVKFMSGETYKYYSVEPSVFEYMKSAKSKGHFVWTRLRGKHRYTKIGRVGWRGPRHKA